MVFVSGVYSENQLKDYFDIVKTLYKDNHYFVCQLLKPKTKRYKYAEQLKNKTAIVTGASHGIGLEIGRRFLLAGANVVFSDYVKFELEN